MLALGSGEIAARLIKAGDGVNVKGHLRYDFALQTVLILVDLRVIWCRMSDRLIITPWLEGFDTNA